jgi:hypothetical protein
LKNVKFSHKIDDEFSTNRREDGLRASHPQLWVELLAGVLASDGASATPLSKTDERSSLYIWSVIAIDRSYDGIAVGEYAG